MTAVHEPGEVWHIGWDWHAHMWFVEPPFDVELDDPMVWFNDRDKAFGFVDQWIREQPVQASVVDQIEQKFEDLTVVRHEDNPLLGQGKIPPALLRAQEAQRRQKPSEPVEPKRMVYANDAAAARVDDYKARVGLG